VLWAMGTRLSCGGTNVGGGVVSLCFGGLELIARAPRVGADEALDAPEGLRPGAR
jgi:hypothetical protein